VVTYDVVIQVSNRDLRLMPGMTANVSIVISRQKDVLKVSNAALRFRPERPAGTQGSANEVVRKRPSGPAVWVLENGKPTRVAVTLGITDGINTEIVSGDLKEGQAVIVEAIRQNSGGASRPPRIF
jgi:HlyD family secretion protein